MNTTDTAAAADRIDEALIASVTADARTRLAAGAPEAEHRAAAIEAAATAAIRDRIGKQLSSREAVLTGGEQQRLSLAVIAHLAGMGRIATLLADDSLEDIFVQGAEPVWVRRFDGKKTRLDPVAETDAQLIEMARALAAQGGQAGTERRFDVASPELDLQLPGGARLHALMDVVDHPTLSIRRHRLDQVTLDELQELGTLHPGIADLLRAVVEARLNVMIAGRTSAGKTTLLRAIAGTLPWDERLLTIEDNYELNLGADERHGHVVAAQERLPNVEGKGAFELRRIVKSGTRMNPDRVVVGEVRGPEAVEMLTAMCHGDDGSLSTIHARSSQGVFAKLQVYCGFPPYELRPELTSIMIAEALDLVVFLDITAEGRRQVTSVREVMDADGIQVTSNEIWRQADDGQMRPHAPLSAARARRLTAVGWRPPEPGIGRGGR